VAGERDEIDTPATGLIAHRPADFTAVDVGKPDIDEGDVGRLRARLLDGLPAGARRSHVMSVELQGKA